MRHKVWEIQRISARNLLSDTKALLNVYFKIVVNEQVIYVSEVSVRTKNPLWVSIEFDESSQKLFQSSPSFDLVVCSITDEELSAHNDSFMKENKYSFRQEAVPSAAFHVNTKVFQEADHMEVFRLNIVIEDLYQISKPIDKIVSNLPNLTLFQLQDGWYAHEKDVPSLKELGVITAQTFKQNFENRQAVRCDLTLACKELSCMVELDKERTRKVEELQSKRKSMEKAIEKHEGVVKLSQVKSQHESRIHELRKELDIGKRLLNRERDALDAEKDHLDRSNVLAQSLDNLKKVDISMDSTNEEIRENRTQVLHLAHSIRLRQAFLVKQLQSIYPIERLPSKEYAIRGIKLQHGDLAGRDEEQVSTSLGYVAHLVFMLSKYLQVPLRYQIKHVSSRSYLIDEVQGLGGEYPLYRKGVDKDRFEKALIYLTKNIIQLMFSRGIEPNPKAPILAQLKQLMDNEVRWLSSVVATAQNEAVAPPREG